MTKISAEKRMRERGQVLLTGVLALIILLFAAFFLFDVQNIIRGKVKAQTGVDSAALVGANWQRHTLNVLGELNLVKATTVLLSDNLFGIGADKNSFLYVGDGDVNEFNRVDAEQRQGKLRKASDLVSQLQMRTMFIVPMIGFGAAQQAAKNNGVNYNSDFGEAVLYQRNLENGFSDVGDLYRRYREDDYCVRNLYGFPWYKSYTTAMDQILMNDGGTPKGVAVLPNGVFMNQPRIRSDSPMGSWLGRKEFYYALQGADWCYLKNFLDQFSGANPQKWWGTLTVELDNSFPMESEFLPVGVELRSADTGHSYIKSLNTSDTLEKLDLSWKPQDQRLNQIFQEWKDPQYDSSGKPVSGSDIDRKLNPLTAIDWAFFRISPSNDHDFAFWEDYSSEKIDRWNNYLDGTLRTETAYRSGAISRMDIVETPVSLMSTLGGSRTDENKATVADAFRGVGGASAGSIGRTLSRERSVEQVMRYSIPKTYTYAVAKPFGTLSVNGKLEPPFHSGIVLPVFDRSALVPVALEDPGRNMLADFLWYRFLIEYIPALGKVSRVDDVAASLKSDFDWYHTLLRDRADNADWRNNGTNWLYTATAWDEDGNATYWNYSNCNYWPSGGGSPGGPSVLH